MRLEGPRRPFGKNIFETHEDKGHGRIITGTKIFGRFVGNVIETETFDKNYRAEGKMDKAGKWQGPWTITDTILIGSDFFPATFHFNYVDSKATGYSFAEVTGGKYDGAIWECNFDDGQREEQAVLHAGDKIIATWDYQNGVMRKSKIFDIDSGKLVEEVNQNESRQRHGRNFHTKYFEMDEEHRALFEAKGVFSKASFWEETVTEDYRYDMLDTGEKRTIVDGNVVNRELHNRDRMTGMGTHFLFENRYGDEFLTDFYLTSSGVIKPQEGTFGWLNQTIFSDPEVADERPDFTYNFPALPYAIRAIWNYETNSLDLTTFPNDQYPYPEERLEQSKTSRPDNFRPIHFSGSSLEDFTVLSEAGIMVPLKHHTPISNN